MLFSIVLFCVYFVTVKAKPGFYHDDDLDVSETNYGHYGKGGGYYGYAIVKPGKF